MAWRYRDGFIRACAIAMLASLAIASSPSRSLLQAPAQREMEALLEWKKSLQFIDASSFIKTWDAKNPLCGGQWAGISCRAGRVNTLFLRGNKCTGTLPKQLSVLEALSFVDFSDNRFNGPLPPEFSTLNPSKLTVADNFLDGQLPPQYSVMANLRDLDLGGNYFVGSLPNTWSTLTMLNNLNVGGNRLTGELPMEWSTLKRLQEIDLGGNTFRGGLPETWLAIGEDLMSKVTMRYSPPPPPRPSPPPPPLRPGVLPKPSPPPPPPPPPIGERGVPTVVTTEDPAVSDTWPIWQIVTIMALGLLALAALGALITVLVCCCFEKKKQKKRAMYARQDMETAKIPLTQAAMQYYNEAPLSPPPAATPISAPSTPARETPKPATAPAASPASPPIASKRPQPAAGPSPASREMVDLTPDDEFSD